LVSVTHSWGQLGRQEVDMQKLERDGIAAALRATCGYADWMLAFGFARLGDPATAASLLVDRGVSQWCSDDIRSLHSFLHHLYAARVQEALGGVPHQSPIGLGCDALLDAELAPLTPEGATCLDEKRRAYTLARFIQVSRILEPDREPDAYLPWNRARRDAQLWNERGGGKPALVTDSTGWRAELDRVLAQTRRVPRLISDVVEFLSQLSRAPWHLSSALFRVVFERLPACLSTFTTTYFFSEYHLHVADAAVLAIAGTGPRKPADDWLERRRVLQEVRSAVLEWIERGVATCLCRAGTSGVSDD
jgi:hypothetical protein